MSPDARACVRPSAWLARALAACLALALSTPAAPARAQANWARSSASVLRAQGDAEATAGRFDAAARHYLDALALDPTFADVYLALGALRERSGDPREAERVYGTALEHVVGFVEAYLSRARVRRRLGYVREAEADLEAALREDPGDRRPLEELARWKVESGAWPEALVAYRRLCEGAERAGEHDALVVLRAKTRGLRALTRELDPLQGPRPRGWRWLLQRAAARAGY